MTGGGRLPRRACALLAKTIVLLRSLGTVPGFRERLPRRIVGAVCAKHLLWSNLHRLTTKLGEISGLAVVEEVVCDECGAAVAFGCYVVQVIFDMMRQMGVHDDAFQFGVEHVTEPVGFVAFDEAAGI